MDTGCTLPEAWVLGNEELLYILPAPMHTLYSGSQRGPTVQEEKGLVCAEIYCKGNCMQRADEASATVPGNE